MKYLWKKQKEEKEIEFGFLMLLCSDRLFFGAKWAITAPKPRENQKTDFAGINLLAFLFDEHVSPTSLQQHSSRFF